MIHTPFRVLLTLAASLSTLAGIAIGIESRFSLEIAGLGVALPMLFWVVMLITFVMIEGRWWQNALGVLLTGGGLTAWAYFVAALFTLFSSHHTAVGYYLTLLGLAAAGCAGGMALLNKEHRSLLVLRHLVVLLLVSILPIGLSSCGESKMTASEEAAYSNPWQTRARDVARLALVEWNATGMVPDSIEKVLKHSNLRDLTGWDGGINKVYTAIPGTIGGNYHCTYSPYIRRSKDVLWGSREPETLGFQVVTWGGDNDGYARVVILGLYGTDGKPSLFEVEGSN